MASQRPSARALDLCCGTGDVALSLAKNGLQVVGLDFSEPMLEVARRRLAESFREAVPASGPQPSMNPEFLHGDAQSIPFPEATFDVVTISYGLRNLADWELGLREMQRVTKPGGCVAVLDFGKPDNAVWRSIYFGYLRHFVPLLGRVFCGDADTHGYILESLVNYAAQKGVAQKMASLGLEDVRIVNLMGGVMSINWGRKPSVG